MRNLHKYLEDIPCEKTYNGLSRNTINLYIYEKQLQYSNFFG
jgi:hypothetical protein